MRYAQSELGILIGNCILFKDEDINIHNYKGFVFMAETQATLEKNFDKKLAPLFELLLKLTGNKPSELEELDFDFLVNQSQSTVNS